MDCLKMRRCLPGDKVLLFSPRRLSGFCSFLLVYPGNTYFSRCHSSDVLLRKVLVPVLGKFLVVNSFYLKPL